MKFLSLNHLIEKQGLFRRVIFGAGRKHVKFVICKIERHEKCGSCALVPALRLSVCQDGSPDQIVSPDNLPDALYARVFAARSEMRYARECRGRFSTEDCC